MRKLGVSARSNDVVDVTFFFPLLIVPSIHRSIIVRRSKRGRAIGSARQIRSTDHGEERRGRADIPTRREVEVTRNLFEELRDRETGARTHPRHAYVFSQSSCILIYTNQRTLPRGPDSARNRSCISICEHNAKTLLVCFFSFSARLRRDRRNGRKTKICHR